MRFGERPVAKAAAARAWCPGRPAVITAVAFPRGSRACLSQAVQAGTRPESPWNSRYCRLGHKQQLGTWDGAKVGGVQRKWLDGEQGQAGREASWSLVLALMFL